MWGIEDQPTTRLGRWLDAALTPVVLVLGVAFMVIVVLIALPMALLVRVIVGRDELHIEYEKTWVGARIEDCDR